jgi:hypothetical protein
MFKKYEVEQIIKDSLLDVDGRLDDKPNEDGLHDIYFVNVEDSSDGIIAEFITFHDKENHEHDKYKITVEFLG